MGCEKLNMQARDVLNFPSPNEPPRKWRLFVDRDDVSMEAMLYALCETSPIVTVANPDFVL
jgi:hypothetical protein